MIGSTVSHYRIVSELGRGGMGVVYEALDEKLDRPVALKFIAGHLTSDATAKERFIREARAAAMLQHDAICAIYDVHEAPDGSTYIVMPLYQGTILKDLIAQGPVAPERALSFCRQIAAGLRAAHDKGLIHRDIKPGNILVTTDDRIKILDFGLAKLVGEADLTVSSSTVGTMAYMSPEQVQGQKVDARSDLWSLGIILYEMLSGRRPFTGEYDAAVVYGIVNQAVDFVGSQIPEPLLPMLERLLDKDPGRRTATAGEVIKQIDGLMGGSGESSISAAVSSAGSAAVGMSGSASASTTPGVATTETASTAPLSETLTPSTTTSFIGTLKGRIIISAAAVVILLGLWVVVKGGPGGPDERVNAVASGGQDALPSVAVMYIENNTPRERLGYVIRDMLARNLGRADSIRVVSNQRLKDILLQETGEESESVSSSTATRVARQAGIQSMIMGSIVQLGSQFILEVELSDVETGNIVDAVSVTAATEGDIMEAVNEVTSRILSGTGSMMASENGALRIQDVSTSSLSAYELYELGQDHEDHWRFAQAVETYKAAIGIDSTFVSAYVGAVAASDVFGFNPTSDKTEPRTFLAAANRHLDAGSQKERDLVELLNQQYSNAPDTLLVRSTLALADKYPDDKRLQLWATFWTAGDVRSVHFNRMFELDPGYALGYNAAAYTHLYDGNLEEAVSNVRRYMALQPDILNTMDSGWEVMTSAGMEQEALSMLDRAFEAHPDWTSTLWRKAYTLAIEGDTTGTWELMDRYAETVADPDYSRASLQSKLALAYGQWERGRILSATALREARRFKDDLALLYDLRNHAAVLHAVDRHEEAEQILNEAVEISRQVYDSDFNPIPVLAAYQNGVGYGDAGDQEHLSIALEQMNVLLQQPGMDNRHRLYLSLLEANLALLEGDVDRAARFVEDRIQLVTTPQGVRLAAWVLGLRGDTEQALRRFHFVEHGVMMRSFELGAHSSFFIDHALARYETARMFDTRGDRDEAIRRYRDALADWQKTGADFKYVGLARARVAELERGN